MKEKLDILYKKYLFEKLDAIFKGEDGVKHSNNIVKYSLFSENDETDLDEADLEEEKRKEERLEKRNDKKFKVVSRNEFVRREYDQKKDRFVDIYLKEYYLQDKNGYLYGDGESWIEKPHNGISRTADVWREKYRYLKTDGEYLIHKDFSYAFRFKNGFGMVFLDGNYNFVGKNGKLLSENGFSYNKVWQFSRVGLAKVRDNKKYNFLDTNGNLVSKIWFDKVWEFKDGYIKVRKDGKYNFMDTKGNLISDVWYDKGNLIDITSNFFVINNNKFIPHKIEMDDYQVNKKLFGYECQNEIDKYNLKYQPIKRYGFRYTLCLNKDKVILYDRVNDEYKELCSAYDISYDNNFIVNKNTKKVYLIYENKMIDITDYYKIMLRDKDEVNITSGIGEILLKDEFYILKRDQILKLFEEEKERKQKAKEHHEREKQKEKLRQQKEELLKKQKDEQDKIQKIKVEALKKIKEGFMMLKDSGKVDLSDIKEKVDNVFVDLGDHKEIDPDFKDILQVIDLSLMNFANVNVSGIDFTGTNIEISHTSLDPQRVYNKNLRGCDFTGIYIDHVVVFDGVDIRGAKFSIDNNDKTFDLFNASFKNAIYDDTTTYNGVPISKYIDVSKQQHEKHMEYLESLKEGNQKNRA